MAMLRRLANRFITGSLPVEAQKTHMHLKKLCIENVEKF